MKIPTEHLLYIVKNEDGFVLVTTLLILTLLMITGIAGMNTSVFETEIAGNLKLHQQAFYEAEGAIEAGAELVEQNISCPKGFTKTEITGQALGQAVLSNTTATTDDDIVVEADALLFWQQVDPDITISPNEANGRDIYYPFNYNLNGRSNPHTNLNIGGNTTLSSGSALQMAAGYEGKGKGAAGAGAYISYDIIAQYCGPNNSASTLLLEWRHVIGEEGSSCNY